MTYDEIKYNKMVKEVEVSGTVTTSATTVTPTKGLMALRVTNINESKNLLVSFDGGSTWFTILPITERIFTKGYDSFQIKGSDTGTTAEYSYLERL